jgi:MFS transporter, ACS family, solute carrier family 17 (sodium-dependent inorganic phosphate cotransporter), other
MGFLAIVNAYTMRVSLSVAIVQMVGSSNASANDPNACPTPPNQGGEIVEVEIP